ncbi:hypothetical protein SBA1_1380002 [Candidatus Sulfotelmatobacter kueseliae]|uniref:Uncharacterized protein n=1 Tax=Candidatus Sulfotelmatobacter kueseliae TaxID=2042962 RepID=A0A2U3K619_9BACT|nr:hypothetical protein SBA1_1380002 [Candidatus Sulfotelmatobacter kueseliae]
MPGHPLTSIYRWVFENASGGGIFASSVYIYTTTPQSSNFPSRW